MSGATFLERMKVAVRRWLGIAPEVAEPVAPKVWEPAIGNDPRVHLLLGKYDTTVRQIVELQQKFDALAELLGIGITVDGDGALVHSATPGGLLDGAKEYVAAVRALEIIAETNARVLRLQALRMRREKES